MPGEILAFSLNSQDNISNNNSNNNIINSYQCSCDCEEIKDCVNSVSVHRSLPLVAVGSGQRKLPLVCRRFGGDDDGGGGDNDERKKSKSDSESESDSEDEKHILLQPPSDNMLRIMKLPFNWKEF